MKTFAAVLEQVNQPLALCELEIPALLPGQVLVDVRYSSICHTQINEIRGLKGVDKFLPHTLGHEGSGIVLENGSGVTKVKPGDEVVLTWIAGDGMNVPGCRYGFGERAVNSGSVSTFLSRAVVSENRLVPTKGVPLDLMPLLGCAIPTGFGIVKNNIRPGAGSSLCVWGMGGVGLSTVLGAKAMQCETIIAVDIKPEKLEFAKSLGATHAVDGSKDPVGEIMKITGGKGVDYGVDCAGHIKTIESGYASIRKGGGRFIVAGNPPHGQKITLDPFDLISGKNISGTWGGETKSDVDIPFYQKIFSEGQLPLEKLVTHREKLKNINDAVLLMEAGRTGRIIIENN